MKLRTAFYASVFGLVAAAAVADETVVVLQQPLSQPLTPVLQRELRQMKTQMTDKDLIVQRFKELVAENPERAQSLLDKAVELWPDLAAELNGAYAELAAIGMVEPAAGPAVAAAAGGGGLSAGTVAGGVAAAGAGAAAAGGGGGGGSETSGTTSAADSSNTSNDDSSDSSSGDSSSGSSGDSSGDSSSDDSSGGNSSPEETPSEPVAVPADFETPEYYGSKALDRIKASSAYARGYTGKGVVVGVIDSGLDTTHIEFVDRIDAGSYNFVDHSSNVNDPISSIFNPYGHGTMVSGAIVGNNNNFTVGPIMHGVAYEAKVRMYQVGTPLGNLSSYAFLEALDQARIDNLPIVNMSLTYDGGDSSTYRQIDDAVVLFTSRVVALENAGTLVVVAAGNDGQAHPALPGLAPYVAPSNKDSGVYSYVTGSYSGAYDEDWSSAADGLLTVVALDVDGSISSFSNRCGAAAAFCLAAPGNTLTLPAADGAGGYEGDLNLYVSGIGGTSFAAPQVAGAAALLKQAFPHLTNTEIAEILLTTANKTGIYADSSVYGQGLLDLDAATQPIGTLSSSGFALDGQIVASGALGSDLNLASANWIGQDKYSRSFFEAGQRYVSAAPRSQLLDESAAWLSESNWQIDVGFNGSFDGGARFAFQAPAEDSVDAGNMHFVWQQKLGDVQFNVASGHGVQWQNVFENKSLADAPLVWRRWAVQQRANPYQYALLDENAVQTGINLPLSEGVTFESSVWQNAVDEQQLTGSLAAVQWQEGPLKTHLSIGHVTEDGAFLGSYGTGSFAVQGAETLFWGVETDYRLNDNWTVSGQVWQGQTRVAKSHGSAWADDFRMMSTAAGLELMGQSVWTANDVLQVAVQKPLGVQSGAAGLLFNGANGQNDVKFAPQSREIKTEVRYATPLGQDVSGGVIGWHRLNANHANGVQESGVLLMLQLLQ